jgi:predicted nuclease with TOPRIM domain
VDELRDFLTESARYLDEIQELVDGLRNAPPAYITELQERVKHVRSRRETIERRLPKGIDSVDDAETYVRDLRRRIDSLDDAVRELQEFLRDAPVPEGVQSTERIERIDDRADSLRRRLADLREHLPGSNCVSNARFTSQDISRRATMAGVSTVFAAVVTRLLFHSDEVVVSTVVFGYGGEVAETEASITTRLSNTQQGYGEYRYGGASGSR